MDCKEIIIAKLKELGAEGLCTEDCGCPIDDLCLCDLCCLDCEPAKKIENPDDSDFPEIFVSLLEKEEVDEI